MIECLECGSTMSVTREDVSYAFSGLSGVVLEDVEVRRCQQCGEEEVVLDRMESIHQEIAKRLIEKPGRLVSEEFRFLRKYLGLSGAQFADQVGVAHETVSRWENGEPIGGSAERLLRLLADSFTGSGKLPEWLASVGTAATSTPMSIRVPKQPSDSWPSQMNGCRMAIVRSPISAQSPSHWETLTLQRATATLPASGDPAQSHHSTCNDNLAEVA